VKLDRSQAARAAIETEQGRTFEVRHVVTHRDGQGNRVLTSAVQGRFTYETEDDAQVQVDAIGEHNSIGRLESVFGPGVAEFQVRAVAVYPGHHDPLSAFFDSDEENPGQFIAGVALSVWARLDANERKGVTFGLFPAEKTQAGIERLAGIRDAHRLLSVALMEKAARTPAGISLASLGRVAGRRKAVAR
jgi:hypothetical protein